MTKTAFITGNSSGLGAALTQHHIQQGDTVYGLSRRGSPLEHPKLHDVPCDLAELETIEQHLSTLLGDCQHLDYVYLNAGMLGQLQAIHEASITQLKAMLNINLWSNKVILDWLLKANIHCAVIIAISSGAANSGSRGWSGYALSKAGLNTLMQLYAHEWPDSQLIALAPGLIDTAMMDYLNDDQQISVSEFPAVQRLRDARGTEAMQTTTEAAARIHAFCQELHGIKSGSFVDIRQ